MTANHDPDRLLRAWLDLMPDEAPDRTIDAVLQATEHAPQRRDRLGPLLRRFPAMTRFTYAAAAAVIIAVVAGGALFFRPGADIGGPPAASPTPSGTPTSTLTVAPEGLRGTTWLAATAAGTSTADVSAIPRLVFGNWVSIVTSGVKTFESSPVASEPTEFDLVSTDTAGGCQIGDLGRYTFAFGSDGTLPASDGTQLAFTMISDACPARAAALQNRGWIHAIDADSTGGRGVAAAFAPMFLVTLPPATYIANRGPDWLSVAPRNEARTLFAVRNPMGWTDPCSKAGGSRLPIDPTIAAFTAYLETLPGFTVESSDLTIDGQPAVLLTIPSTKTADCPDNRVKEWTTSQGGGWELTQGDTDVVYLVEIDGDLILLQWLGGGVTREEEQALFATVHFTDVLPPTNP